MNKHFSNIWRTQRSTFRGQRWFLQASERRMSAKSWLLTWKMPPQRPNAYHLADLLNKILMKNSPKLFCQILAIFSFKNKNCYIIFVLLSHRLRMRTSCDVMTPDTCWTVARRIMITTDQNNSEVTIVIN